MKLRRLYNKQAAFARTSARTDEIKVGDVYFLSSFYDTDGAMVKVLAKSHKINSAGWPSTVEYEVVERIGDANERLYAAGSRGTCNATNLYDTRETAAPGMRRATLP